MLAKLFGIDDVRGLLREARGILVPILIALAVVGGLWWLRHDAATDAINAPEAVRERTELDIARAEREEATGRAEAAESAAEAARQRAAVLEQQIEQLSQPPAEPAPQGPAAAPGPARQVCADLARLKAAKLARNRAASKKGPLK